MIAFSAMTDADVAEVAALTGAAFAHPWTEGQFRDELQTPQSRTTLLRDGGRLCGYCVCWRVADEVEILLVAVDPTLQRQGLARRILDHVLARESADGAMAFHLEVAHTNTAALALYRSAGFERVGLRKRYYAHSGDDAVLMRRGPVP